MQMKRQILRTILIVAVMPALLGCEQKRPTVGDVEEILASPGGRSYGLLSSFDRTSRTGDIVIVGEPEKTVKMLERFASADFCDNVSGACVSDALPDFAGERISAILDIANAGYDSLFLSDQGNTLRSLSVRALVAALDTACCLAPYDDEFRSRRPAAKAMVYSSPYMDVCGNFDVDTLKRSVGADIPVIYPVRSAFESIFSQREDVSVIAVMPDPCVTPSVYESIFKEFSMGGDRALSSCIPVSTVRKSKDFFRDFLSSYIEEGRNGKISAVLVDDDNCNLVEMQASYKRIFEVQSEENLEFRKFLSRDLIFVYTLDCAARKCYELFRQRNVFTHFIAYPKTSIYITKDLPGSYVLVDYDPSYLPDGLEGMLKQSAPKLFESYVQN